MRTLFVSILLCWGAVLCFSQSYSRKILTRQIEHRMLRTDKKVQQQKNRIEKFVQSNRKQIKIEEVTIPVVFHILYANRKEKVSEAQIQSQLDALNRSFNQEPTTIKQIADRREGFYKKRPNKIQIQFCLAVSNPGKNAKLGMNYISTDVKEWGADDAIKSTAGGKKEGGVKPWNTEKYLNVWVGHLADSVSGYATMPWADKKVDGIVIDYRFFGTEGTAIPPYDEGNTLTHLVGNYLGLYDLWSDDCSDDEVADTPIHNAPNTGCVGYKHYSTCDGYPIEMSMNFMDNSDDACMYMFTKGQMLRMHSMLALQGARKGLITESGSGSGKGTAKGVSLCALNEKEQERLAAAEKIIQPTLKVIPESPSTSMKLRPNPANGRVELVFEGIQDYNSSIHILVFNAAGKEMYNRQLPLQPSVEIETSRWRSGLYFVHSQVGSQILTQRLVINH